MTGFIIGVLVVVAIYLYFYLSRKSEWKNTDPYEVARNALLAKYTFELLDDDDKNRVVTQVKDIIWRGQRGGVDPDLHLKNLRNVVKYQFYSIAFNELDLQPALGNEKWSISPAPNPYSDLSGAYDEISRAEQYFQNEHGIDIKLN